MQNEPTETDTTPSARIGRSSIDSLQPLMNSLDLIDMRNATAMSTGPRAADRTERGTEPLSSTTNATSETNTNSNPSLMSLCMELRAEVYDHIFELSPTETLINPSTTPLPHSHRAIMRTSKQVYHETARRLYCNRRFHLSDRYNTQGCFSSISRFLFKIGPANRALLSQLSLNFTHGITAATGRLGREDFLNGPGGPGGPDTWAEFCNTRARNKATYTFAVLTASVTTIQPLALRSLIIVLPGWIWDGDRVLWGNEVDETAARQKFREALGKVAAGRGLEQLGVMYTREFEKALGLAVDLKVGKLRVCWGTGELGCRCVERLERVGWVFKEGNGGSCGAAYINVPLPSTAV